MKIQRIVVENFSELDYIVVSVYDNGEFDRREKILKSNIVKQFPLYTGQIIKL